MRAPTTLLAPGAALFVAFSKTLDLLVAPLSWAIVLGLAAVALRRRRPRAAAAAGVAAPLLLALFSLPPVAGALSASLERGVEPTFDPSTPYDAVVVLGGMVDAPASRASGALELTQSAERILCAALLVRAGEAREVLVTGGEVFPVEGDVPEAERLAALLVALGVERERIVVEAASRNTRENAARSAQLIRERGWSRVVLVTSAAHLPRALGAFRAEGVAPDALPVDHRAGDGRGGSWLPRAAALDASTDALREWTGRAVYRLAGYAR